MERANPININLSHTIEMVIVKLMLRVKKMTMIQKVVLMTHFVIDVDNDGHSKLEKPARLTIRVFSSVKWKK